MGVKKKEEVDRTNKNKREMRERRGIVERWEECKAGIKRGKRKVKGNGKGESETYRMGGVLYV